MTHYLSYIHDIIGNNYIGINITPGIIEQFLNKLKNILSESDFKVYTENQKNRDQSHYHITVINVMDYNRLSKEIGISKFVNQIESIIKDPIDDIQMLGIGTASKNENRSYFIVCRSAKLKYIRDLFNLPEQDFHITIGFKHKDVFGVRKNEVLKEDSKFIQLLKQEFYKKENFNFVKDIKNFDLSRDLEIIPISISENYLKILCGDFLLDIGCFDDGEFYIFAKYLKDKDVSRLPLTQISKILNKK